jgi:hypothetical protein
MKHLLGMWLMSKHDDAESRKSAFGPSSWQLKRCSSDWQETLRETLDFNGSNFEGKKLMNS